MIKLHLHCQWYEEDSLSLFCVDIAVEKEFLVFLVGFMGILVWVGFGLGVQEDEDESIPPSSKS